MATDLQRVLILSKEASNFGWDTGPLCNSSGTLDRCWLRPLSSCSADDFSGNTVKREAYDRKKEQNAVLTLDIVYPFEDGEYRARVPRVFHPLLNASGIPQKKWCVLNAA